MPDRIVEFLESQDDSGCVDVIVENDNGTISVKLYTNPKTNNITLIQRSGKLFSPNRAIKFYNFIREMGNTPLNCNGGTRRCPSCFAVIKRLGTCGNCGTLTNFSRKYLKTRYEEHREIQRTYTVRIYGGSKNRFEQMQMLQMFKFIEANDGINEFILSERVRNLFNHGNVEHRFTKIANDRYFRSLVSNFDPRYPFFVRHASSELIQFFIDHERILNDVHDGKIELLCLDDGIRNQLRRDYVVSRAGRLAGTVLQMSDGDIDSEAFSRIVPLLVDSGAITVTTNGNIAMSRQDFADSFDSIEDAVLALRYGDHDPQILPSVRRLFV